MKISETYKVVDEKKIVRADGTDVEVVAEEDMGGATSNAVAVMGKVTAEGEFKVDWIETLAIRAKVDNNLPLAYLSTCISSMYLEATGWGIQKRDTIILTDLNKRKKDEVVADAEWAALLKNQKLTMPAPLDDIVSSGAMYRFLSFAHSTVMGSIAVNYHHSANAPEKIYDLWKKDMSTRALADLKASTFESYVTLCYNATHCASYSGKLMLLKAKEKAGKPYKLLNAQGRLRVESAAGGSTKLVNGVGMMLLAATVPGFAILTTKANEFKAGIEAFMENLPLNDWIDPAVVDKFPGIELFRRYVSISLGLFQGFYTTSVANKKERVSSSLALKKFVTEAERLTAQKIGEKLADAHSEAKVAPDVKTLLVGLVSDAELECVFEAVMGLEKKA